MAREDRAVRLGEGLQSDALQAALKSALAGQMEQLDWHLCRAAGWPGGRMNLKLAAAVGAQIASAKQDVTPLLQSLGDDEGAANTPRVILPITAAYGWVTCVRAGRDVDAAWTALAELSADFRHPVRVGTYEALAALCLEPARVDELLARAEGWLDIDDRDLRYGAVAVALQVLGEPRAVAELRDRDRLLSFLDAVIADVSGATRATERVEHFRRVHSELPRAVATAVSKLPGEHLQTWLTEHCEQARPPRLREALSSALVLLRTDSQRKNVTAADAASTSLKASAVPARDPTHARPGTRRGKASRRIR